MAVKPPPEWPFRCPVEGWYLSKVEAEFLDWIGPRPSHAIPFLVTGFCKRHGQVEVKDPYAYAPHLWKES